MKPTLSPHFESVYQQTYETIAKYVYFKVPQLADAEDIVQNVYLRYYREVVLKQKHVDHPQAYLMGIAANELKKFYATKARQPIQLDTTEVDPLDNVPDNADVHLEVINSFTQDLVAQAVRALSPLDQMILSGHFRFELTFTEIAKQLELSENTVKTRYYRALIALRHRLEQQNIR